MRDGKVFVIPDTTPRWIKYWNQYIPSENLTLLLKLRGHYKKHDPTYSLWQKEPSIIGYRTLDLEKFENDYEIKWVSTRKFDRLLI